MKFLELINPERDGLDMVARSVNASEESKSLPGTSSTADVLPLARITTEIVFANPLLVFRRTTTDSVVAAPIVDYEGSIQTTKVY